MGLGMVGPMRVGRIERNFGDGMDFSRQSALIHENALRLNDTHIEIRRARTQSHDISGNHVGLIHRDDLSLSHDVGGSLHDHQTVQIQIASVLKKSHDESSGEANDGVDDGHVVIPERSPGPNHKILIQVKRLGKFLNEIQHIRSHRPPTPPPLTTPDAHTPCSTTTRWWNPPSRPTIRGRTSAVPRCRRNVSFESKNASLRSLRRFEFCKR
mmetsp:Transcript_13695/g.28804  ORF Transcript_13695/g.28804 Transcript_13695/m.28804 type:complete len:212 (-) Transcript_13695:632-1267(-)